MPRLSHHSMPGYKSTRRGLQTLAHCGFVKYQLANACNRGGVVLFICGEAYGSKTCPKCGEVNDKLGGSKTFTCPTRGCGYKEERDINGACNELNKLAAAAAWNQFEKALKYAPKRK